MNVGIVGLGLIGGSIGRAAVKKTAHTVYATDRDENAVIKGALLNAYHETLTHDNAKLLDMLIICVYPSSIEAVIDEYAPLLKDGAIITDCIGTKRQVFKIMEKKQKRYPKLNFIGGHPMSGREFSGVEHSTASLMEHSTCILVPVHNEMDTLIAVKEFYIALGADGVVVATAEEHDKIIAYTSQLAHVISSAYVTSPSALSHYGFSANSFRDMTRVARLNPTMWTELMTENSDFLTEEIDGIIARLTNLRNAVSDKNADALYSLLNEGSERKILIETRRAQKKANALH